MKQITAYELTRSWFAFAFENQGIISPSHGIVYLWNVELCNRMGWAKKFSSPASQTMAACGINSFNTYSKIIKDLVEWGFLIIVKQSTNQYTATVFAISKFDKALYKALDKALMNQLPKQGESTCLSTDSINKQQTTNKETSNNKQECVGASAHPFYINENDFSEETSLQLNTKLGESEKKEKSLRSKKEIEEASKAFSEIYRKHFPEYDFKAPSDVPHLLKIHDRIKHAFLSNNETAPTIGEILDSFEMLLMNLDTWHKEKGMISPAQIDKHFEIHKAYLKKSNSNDNNSKQKYDIDKILSRKF